MYVNIHAEDGTTYSSADVQAGAAVYKAQCAVCHGLEGNAVGGVDSGPIVSLVHQLMSYYET